MNEVHNMGMRRTIWQGICEAKRVAQLIESEALL